MAVKRAPILLDPSFVGGWHTLWMNQTRSREVVANQSILSELQLDPLRQLIGAQCSGTLVLAKLGLLGVVPATI